MKKMMLLALAAASVAIFALPAVASASSAHINATSNFTISGGTWSLSTTGKSTIHCNIVSGNGSFTTTTGGTLSMTFGGTCSTEVFGFKVHCNGSGSSGGHMTTTVLPFDLVMLAATKPGILMTANNNHFASFSCAGVSQVANGTGVLATITAPGCGAASTKWTVDFNAVGHGVPEHTMYTGVKYGSSKGGEPAALDVILTLTFPTSRTINCTF